MNLVARIPRALPWAGIGLRLRRVRPERCPWAACVFGACAQGVAQAESSREEKTVWRSPASCFSAASRSGHRRNRPYTVRQVTSTRVGSSGLKRRLRLTSLYKRKNRLVPLTFFARRRGVTRFAHPQITSDVFYDYDAVRRGCCGERSWNKNGGPG